MLPLLYAAVLAMFAWQARTAVVRTTDLLAPLLLLAVFFAALPRSRSAYPACCDCPRTRP